MHSKWQESRPVLTECLFSKSTDYEVHRNWLAITYELPLSKWYFEATSIWTLDYPPFFAYFEWLLAQFAALVDSKITTVANLDYEANTCLFFQRFSVIVSDLLFTYGCYKVAMSIETLNFPADAKDNTNLNKQNKVSSKTMKIWFALNFLNIGLFLVDNIHF
jgi:alpha-1,3-glucosyltransferase